MNATVSTTTLALIERAFSGKLKLNAVEVAQILGITPGSIRTLRYRGKFNLPSASEGGKHLFDIRDVADLIDAKRPSPQKKRGARTKVQRAALAQATGEATC